MLSDSLNVRGMRRNQNNTNMGGYLLNNNNSNNYMGGGIIRNSLKWRSISSVSYN